MFVALLAGALLNGIVTGMIYALLGIGLSLILGLLNIPNFAQGALYALGGYFLFSLGQALFGFWGGVIIAPFGVAAVGGLIEYAGVRRLYGVHPDYILLLTFGLALVSTELMILIWGPVGITVFPPRLLAGGVAGVRATALRRTRNASRNPADPPAARPVVDWHRRAGWTAVVAAGLGLATAALVLLGMYRRAGLL